MKIIFIDAGHGLGSTGKPDPGAQGLVSERAEIVEIAKETIALLQKQSWITTEWKIVGIGIETPMTLIQQIKETNKICNQFGVSMSESLLVSVHCNKAGGNASGVETWYEGGNNGSMFLGQFVLQSVAEETELPKRGNNSDLANQDGRLGIVRDVTPTSVLVECGFVDHPKDAGVLKDPTKDDSFARGIVKGICGYLELPFTPQYTPGTYPDVAPDRPSASAIALMKDRGIMSGYPDGFFRPEKPVTREELAMVIERLLK